MNPILLSTVLLATFFTLINCAPRDQQKRDYYEVYADAVNYYYREPRRPEQAIQVLRQACRGLRDRQDVSCYNLAIILEYEKRPARALEAYRRAYQLRPHPLYREAIQFLAPAPGKYPTSYFRSFRKMVAACQAEKPAEALLELERLLENDVPGPANPEATDSNPEDLHRAIFEQPVFAECLGKQPRYRQLLETLPERDDDLVVASARYRGANDPFHTVWDMELHLLRLTRDRTSRHPVTAHWQKVMRGGGAAEHLAGFLEELDRVAAEAPAAEKRDTEIRVLAMKRAAAILITKDPFFGGLRGNARVRRLIAPYLKP